MQIKEKYTYKDKHTGHNKKKKQVQSTNFHIKIKTNLNHQKPTKTQIPISSKSSVHKTYIET